MKIEQGLTKCFMKPRIRAKFCMLLCSLLQAAIGVFSTSFPDYQDRIARHEAAHFLGALSGIPLILLLTNRTILTSDDTII